MKFELSLKEFDASKIFYKLLTRYRKKLITRLHNFTKDTSELTVVIKKHKKNTYFTGRFSLKLPLKEINATLGGHKAEAVLSEGFEKLLRKYESYKGKHFKGYSKYSHHESIRKPEKMKPHVLPT